VGHEDARDVAAHFRPEVGLVERYHASGVGVYTRYDFFRHHVRGYGNGGSLRPASLLLLIATGACEAGGNEEKGGYFVIVRMFLISANPEPSARCTSSLPESTAKRALR